MKRYQQSTLYRLLDKKYFLTHNKTYFKQGTFFPKISIFQCYRTKNCDIILMVFIMFQPKSCFSVSTGKFFFQRFKNKLLNYNLKIMNFM